MISKKFYIFLCMFLVSLSFVVAVDCGNNNIGSYELGSNVILRQTCSNCTYVNLSSIITPSGQYYYNVAMTKNGIDYKYLINVDEVGEYFYSVFGNKDGFVHTEVFCFDVKPYTSTNSFGVDFSSNITLVVFILFLIIACLLLFVFKFKLLPALIFVLLGFILLFSGVSWLLAILLIFGGLVVSFLK